MTIINPDGEKTLFDSRQPADDVANYLELWSAILQNARGYTRAGEAAALQVLPDILQYDRYARHLPQQPRAHRRRVQHALRWLTNGKVSRPA